jgi:hypothetical protein
MQQLLWLETLVKLGCGSLLVLFPTPIIHLLGLAHSPGGFWPRMFGAALIGMAAATFVEGRFGGAQGLSLTGVVAINLSLALFLIAQLVMQTAAPTFRGRLVVWAVAIALVVMSLIEIGHL